MKNLPMDVLRAFVTIVEVGGFTQAGEILGRSQPAISLQIKRLEEQLEKPLLVRDGPRIGLTDAGSRLLEYAKKILALNDEAVASFDTNEVSGSIKLGIPSEFALTLLPRIVSRFCNTYPNVTLEVFSDLSRNLSQDLKRNRYDLILKLHDEPNVRDASLIKMDELVWVGSRNTVLNQGRPISLVAAPEGCIYRSRATSRLQVAGQPWRIVYTIPDLTGIASAIDEGLGVTVLARSTVPSGLKILKTGTGLPELGSIGISLDVALGGRNAASERLIEYLQAGLSHY